MAILFMSVISGWRAIEWVQNAICVRGLPLPLEKLSDTDQTAIFDEEELRTQLAELIKRHTMLVRRAVCCSDASARYVDQRRDIVRSVLTLGEPGHRRLVWVPNTAMSC
jgi:hypothetical protein